MWDKNARDLLLSEENFEKNYCSAQTKSLIKNNPVHFDNFRRVVTQLTELMPNTAHHSPKWTTPPKTLIVAGRCSNGHTIRQHRIGLCVVKNSLYLWTDLHYLQGINIKENVFFPAKIDSNPLDQAADTWVPWRTHNKGKGVEYRFSTPVDLRSDDPINSNHPLHVHHPVAKALTQLDTWIANNPFSNEAEFKNNPFNTDVIYPKLFELNPGKRAKKKNNKFIE